MSEILPFRGPRSSNNLISNYCNFSNFPKVEMNKKTFYLFLSCQVMNEDGHTSSIRDKILTINVKPGWRSGTKITFPKEGDQGPNNIPGTDIN